MNHHEIVKGLSAENLLRKFELFSAPVDLDSLSEKLKISVSRDYDWEKDYSGEIYVKSGEVHCWISPMEPDYRQRFTLAHEIGHYINDIAPKLAANEEAPEFHDKAETLKRDGRQDHREYRANDYAAKLLMPKDLILENGVKIIANYKEAKQQPKIPRGYFIQFMAEKFDVSKKAMEIRLSNLGLLPRS